MPAPSDSFGDPLGFWSVEVCPSPKSHDQALITPVDWSVNVAVIGVVVTLKAACGAGGPDGRGLTGRQADSAKPVMAISPTNSHRRAPVRPILPIRPPRS